MAIDKYASPTHFLADIHGLVERTKTAGIPSRELVAEHLIHIAQRVAGRRLVASKKPLYGHVNEATAYVVDDYPYGFRLRTKIRYWLEKNPGKGFRFVSQTMDPKAKTERWNKPKASTYMKFAGAMYLDSQNHVQWKGLSEYSDGGEVLEFVQEFPGADYSLLKPFAKAKLKFLFDMIDGKRFMTINGERVPVSEEDKGRWEDEAIQWHEAITYMK